MRRTEAIQILTYGAVSLLSVGAAFLISLQFIGTTSAQTGPPTTPPPAEVPAAPAPQPSSPVSAGFSDIEGFLEPFIYDVLNRRDPFLPYAEYVPAEEGPSRPMSPAQKFNLEDLRLVGILWDVKEPKAMFVDPTKDVLTLRRDDSIGNRNGYIAAIREGEVVVVEAIRRRGDIIYRTKVLRIER